MKEEDIRNRDLFNKYLELSAKDAEHYFSNKENYSQINCPACDEKESPGIFEKHGFNYCKCNNCDTIYCNPRPPLAQFLEFYKDSPSTQFWVNEFFMTVAEQRRIKMIKPRAEFINELLGVGRDLIIGDIGAGFGIFLEELRKLRPNDRLIAIEPSVEMANICRGKNLEVIEKLIEEVDDCIQFDVLISFELFEHLYNPKDFAKNVFKLLKPGGKLILTTLSGLGFDIQVLWNNSKSISPPHHINFFNPHSIKLLFEECGFSESYVTTPGVLDWNIIEGGFLSDETNPGHFWETVSKYGTEESKKELQNWISNSGFSSHMRLIAVK